MTEILFNICNTLMILVWGFILFAPNISFSKQLIAFPWVPIGISFFYTYFLIISGGISEADLTSILGITTLFQNATTESAAAGWLHYLAFDFWVGTWIIRHSQKHFIRHWMIILPLIFTFMLGPVGVLIYGVIYAVKTQFKKAK